MLENEILEAILKELKENTLVLKRIEKLFTKYDSEYQHLVEADGNLKEG